MDTLAAFLDVSEYNNPPQTPAPIAPLVTSTCQCRGAGWYYFLPRGADPKSFSSYVLRKCDQCEDIEARKLGLRHRSGIPSAYARYTFRTFTPDKNTRTAFDALQNSLAMSHQWLTLHGANGVGKSHLLAATVQAAIERGISARYTVMADILTHIKKGYNPSATAVTEDGFWDSLLQVGVLAIDEVDRAYWTPWARQKFEELVGWRDTHPGITLFATNKDLADNTVPLLDDAPGYIESRMWRQGNLVLRIQGSDKRRYVAHHFDDN